MRKRGITLTEGSFAAAISAHGKAGQWERAVALLDEMENDNLTANSYCFNAAIQGKGDRNNSLRVTYRALVIKPEIPIVILGAIHTPGTLRFRPILTSLRCSRENENFPGRHSHLLRFFRALELGEICVPEKVRSHPKSLHASSQCPTLR